MNTLVDQEQKKTDDTQKVKEDENITAKELISVFAVIAILAIVVVGSVRTAQTKAYATRAQSDIEIINSMIELYAKDHDGVYPVANDYAELKNVFLQSLADEHGDPPMTPPKKWEYFVTSTEHEYSLYAKGPKDKTITCTPEKCEEVKE